MKKIEIKSVNISEKKGTVKKPANFIQLNDAGVLTDAHAGTWHRQVSMLGTESIGKFSQQAGKSFHYGDFAENITTTGIELYKCNVFDRFIGDEIILEVTQIGKQCHGSGCAIFNEVGNCIMPKEGIFCRVLKGGTLKAGDTLTYQPRIFTSHIFTVSDRASRGEYTDRSGPRIAEKLKDFFDKTNRQYEIQITVIPDDALLLKEKLTAAIDNGIDIVFTTGGTGIGPRDITIDAIFPLLDKEIPGIMDFIRNKYGAEKPNALISRSVAGIMGHSFVFALPGSVKAVEEYCTEILNVLDHLFLMFYGIDAH